MNSRSNTISNCENELIAAGAIGVKDYIVKLHQNSGTAVFADLLWEAEVALTLLDHGFSVTLRDAPDLDVRSGAEVFYVEVTHFRRRAQDAVDEAAMQTPDDGYLVRYGDPQQVQQQVFDKIKGKLAKCSNYTPLIIAISSSSDYQVEEVDVKGAINQLDEQVQTGADPALARLSGVLFFGPWTGLRDYRDVFFFPTQYTSSPLGSTSRKFLDSLRFRHSRG